MGRPLQAEKPDTGAVEIAAPDNDMGHPAHKAVSGEVTIQDKKATILIQPFDDTIFVTVTQNNRLGTMVSGEVDTVGGTGGDSYSITVLIGKRDEMMLELIARRIIGDMVTRGCRKKLLLSAAFKDHALSLVDPVVDAVLSLRTW